MANPAQMEQELQAAKAGGMPQGQSSAPPQGQPQGQPQGSPAGQPQGQGGQSAEMQMLVHHLDSLPEQQKAYVAQYLSPEIAEWAGIVFGSDEVKQYFSSLADPNITLVPVPKDVAEKAMAQQNSSEGSMPPAQAQPSAGAPAAPVKPPMGTEHM